MVLELMQAQNGNANLSIDDESIIPIRYQSVINPGKVLLMTALQLLFAILVAYGYNIINRILSGQINQLSMQVT